MVEKIRETIKRGGVKGRHWKLSEETKEKMKKATNSGRFVNGHIGYNKGKRLKEKLARENPENWRKWRKRYRDKHKEEARECTKKWRKDNHEKVLMQWKRARVRKRNAEGSHTLGEWELLKKQYGYICPCCRRSEPEIKLTEDHIIPLSKGGSDLIENIQPLCRSCNSKKYTKITKYKTIIKKGWLNTNHKKL